MIDGPEHEQEARDTSGTLFASDSGSGKEQKQLRQGNPRQPQSGPWVQPRPPYPGAIGSPTPPTVVNRINTHGVVLANGEQPVREYHVTRMERPNGDGYLLVTNRRLLFVSEAQEIAGHSVLIRETHLPDISGVTGYVSKGLSIGRIILIALLTFFCLGWGFLYWPLFLTLALPAYLVWRLWKSQGKEITLVIRARGQSESSVELVTRQNTGIFGRRYPLAGVILGPGPDAERAIQEIGALVLDLQTLGDVALELWTKAEGGLA
jgi:hypothetical protein